MSATELPAVSIIIPTFNRAGFLKAALDSALAQTYPAVEVIVVDDGSSDDTQAVLRAYAGRIRVQRQSNRGVSAARNAGLKLSSGAYVTFLDDDDLLYPRKIALQVQRLEAQPGAGFVHCRQEYIDFNGRVLGRGGIGPQGNVLAELVRGNFIWAGAPLIRRSVLEQVGGFNETLSAAADYDLWLRICAAGYGLECVQVHLGAYRLHPGSMVTALEQTGREVLAILEGLYSRADLPAGVLALRDSAYAEWHLWLSRRFFAAGDLESGRSNLNLAFRHDPDLAADSERLLLAFEQEAVDWRSPGPLACVENLYASLPPEATGLAGQKERLTARVRLDLALRALAGGDTTGARALCLDSSLPVQLFVRAVTHAALTLPVDPLEFTDRCLALLPAGTRALHRQVSASVLAACGFDDFHSGLRRRAARRFLHAVWLSPGWLRNRGVRAALVKSLADFLVLRAEVVP